LPHHKSAEKRIRQDKKRRARNRAVKSEVKLAVKKVTAASTADDGAKVLPGVSSVIDKAAKKGVLHRRTAARKKSRLAKRVKSLSG
jgi:small subunit ribosomal protein S20